MEVGWQRQWHAGWSAAAMVRCHASWPTMVEGVFCCQLSVMRGGPYSGFGFGFLYCLLMMRQVAYCNWLGDDNDV